MNNFTILPNEETTENEFRRTKFQMTNWIISECLFGVYAVVSLWVLASMIHYGIKRRKFVCVQRRTTDGHLMYGFVFCVISVSIPRLAALQAIQYSFARRTDDLTCSVAMFGFKVLYILGLLGTYMMLWVRQRMLYTGPILKDLMKGWFIKLQYVCLASILLTNALGMVNHILPIRTKFSPVGCEEILNVTVARMMHLANVALSSVSQFMLLVLFCYPLYQQVKRNRRMARESRNITQSPDLSSPTTDFTDISTVCSEQKELGRQRTVRNERKDRDRYNFQLTDILKRSTALSTLCVCSDIIIFVVIYVLNRVFLTVHLGLHVYLTIFETNSFINNMAIFLMLRKWKMVLTTFFCTNNDQQVLNDTPKN